MKQKELVFYLKDREFKQSENGFVPFDENMMERGRSIFDAILVSRGKFFDIDSHLERTYAATNIFGAPLEKVFSKKEFKIKLENLLPVIIGYFGKNASFKLEIIASKQLNIFLRAVSIDPEWLDSKRRLVVAAIEYKYLLQSLKYCGRYAEPMIIAELAKQQVDPEIEECLFYSKIKKNGKIRYAALEATNSAFIAIDEENRLWVSNPPDVLPSTTSNIIKKIAEQDMHNPNIPEKEKISTIMQTGFPINMFGYQIKEMFSTSAVRLLPIIKKIVFISIKNDGSKIIVKRTKGIKDIIIVDKTPITDRLRERFRNESGLII